MTITSFYVETTGASQKNVNVTEWIIVATTVTNHSRFAKVSDVFHHLIVALTFSMFLFESRGLEILEV